MGACLQLDTHQATTYSLPDNDDYGYYEGVTMRYQLSELSDIEEIRQISYTYYFALDTSDIDLLMSVFTEDAKFDMRGSGQALLEGADTIREYFVAGQMAMMKGQIHLATNHRVHCAGDTATGTVYYLVHGEAKDGSTISPAAITRMNTAGPRMGGDLPCVIPFRW